MIKIGISIFFLAAIFLLSNYFTYATTKASWYNQGFNDGSIDSRYKILEVLKNEFETVASSRTESVVFSIKASDVVTLTKEGIKTVAIVE